MLRPHRIRFKDGVMFSHRAGMALFHFNTHGHPSIQWEGRQMNACRFDYP